MVVLLIRFLNFPINKFMVIDDHILELGSFNYTQSAESRNAENVLVIHDATRLAIMPSSGTNYGMSPEKLLWPMQHAAGNRLRYASGAGDAERQTEA